MFLAFLPNFSLAEFHPIWYQSNQGYVNANQDQGWINGCQSNQEWVNAYQWNQELVN